MHIRVTISAVIGASRKSNSMSASLNDQGEFRLDFPKDLDWNHSIYLILEPDDETLYRNKYLTGKAKSHAKNYGMAMEIASPSPSDIVAIEAGPPEGYCQNCDSLGGKHSDNCMWKDRTVSGKPRVEEADNG